jgi:hypothetical protein
MLVPEGENLVDDTCPSNKDWHTWRKCRHHLNMEKAMELYVVTRHVETMACDCRQEADDERRMRSWASRYAAAAAVTVTRPFSLLNYFLPYTCDMHA